MAGPRRHCVGVGIDIGRTYTKVALRFPGRKSCMAMFMGKGSGNADDKSLIPTVVAFPKDTNSKYQPLIAWDAQLKTNDVEWDHYQHFKREFPDGLAAPTSGSQGSTRGAEELYVTFLKGLKEMIANNYARSYQSRWGSWEAAEIVFIFSIPAAGGPQQRQKAGAKLVELAFAAGFASADGKHQVAPNTPTEGLASATFAAQEMFLLQGHNEVRLLTADVGSGTSDIAIFKAHGQDGGQALEIRTDLLQPVSGCNIGSSYIHNDFEDRVLTFLKQNEGSFPNGTNFETLAKDSSEDKKFEKAKCDFPATSSGIEFQMEILNEVKIDRNEAGFAVATEHPGNIVLLKIDRTVMKSLFDKQIEMLKTQLDRAIEDMVVKTPLRELYETEMRKKDKDKSKKGPAADHSKINLDIILLSGGLGGSQYVVKAIEDFVRENGMKRNRGSAFHTNLTRARVVVSEKPQLCVAFGLLEILFEPQSSKVRRKKSAFGFLQ